VKIESFATASALFDQTEVEKVRLLAFYHLKTTGTQEFSIEDVRQWFDALHLHAPNLSRLKNRIDASKSFVKGRDSATWKLHATDRDELQGTLPGISSRSEEIESGDSVLPLPIYERTRGFIELLAKQINASFEYNIFDGCAVLMRRLIEVLLILAYEHNNIEAEIVDGNGQFLPLERVIANAKANSKLRLSRDSKAMLDEMRSLGNFSAHKIYFNCRRADVERVRGNYRATVEELLYKSGIRL
jgi:hypothetical protein